MRKIYLIPVPLAEDAQHTLSPQVKEVLQQTDYFLVENLRTARRFISSMKTGKVIENMTFFELDKKTTHAQIETYFTQIPADASVGIMSEAGCPGVADPGAVAVAYAHQKGIEVVPLVGPSSILLALMASGMNGQSFTFHGYLPIDRAERIKSIKNLDKESQTKRQTQIFMETPYRNNHLLYDLLQNLHPYTQLCIAADITAPGQSIKTQLVKDWQKTKPDLNKVPVIYLLLNNSK